MAARKVAKFESDLLKTNKVAKFYRRLYGGGGGGHKYTNVCKFSQLCGPISSLI